jgi:hypothetical protein
MTAVAAAAPLTAGQMLTAAQASQVLGVTARDLADLIAAGWLRPHRHGAHCYPLLQIEALRNNPGAPGAARDPRPGLLRALGQGMPACAGPGFGCQLRHDGQHPHLLIRTAGGAQLTVWLVATSAGWRFLGRHEVARGEWIIDWRVGSCRRDRSQASTQCLSPPLACVVSNHGVRSPGGSRTSPVPSGGWRRGEDRAG